MTSRAGLAMADNTVAGLRERLATTAFGRVVELTLLPDQDAPEIGRRWREAALVSAFHAGELVVFGWLRHRPGGPVKLLTALGGSAETPTVFPPGGRARPEPGTLADLLPRFDFWIRIGAVYGDPPRVAGMETRPLPIEDQLIGVWQQSFGWMALAEPLPPSRIDADADDAAEQQRSAWSRRDSPRFAVEAQRWQHRYEELRRAQATGLWRLHLLAGADTAVGAAHLAALICTSVQVDWLPYTLIPAGPAAAIGTVLDSEVAAGNGLRSPIVASTPLLAAVTVPPETEIPGVRLVAQPAFDVTAESSIHDGPSLTLGTILDTYGNSAGQLDLPWASLQRHTMVAGATGSGKSQTIRGLLERAARAGIPWLVVEPAKAEYRLMANRLPGIDIIVVRPGDPEVPPGGINPLEPAWLETERGTARFPLQTHADLVRALFLASFEADEPFPQVLSAALTTCYEDYGWDLAISEPRRPGTGARYPTLADLTRATERVVGHIGYSEEITRNVTGFIRVRVNSLRHGTTGRFLEGGHRLDFTRLLSRNVIIELEDVADDRDKAFLIGSILIRLVEHLRLQQQCYGGGPQPLRHLAVFEEAHRLLRRTNAAGPAAHAVEMFASLLAEVRAYGQGIVLAEQIPTKILPDALKNTATKIVHRLPARDDRDAVGDTMNLSPAQSRYLVTLPPGRAAVFTGGMDNPLLVQIPDGTGIEAAGPAALASVALISDRRSPTCGADCESHPCTLRQIRHAQLVLHAQPLIALWAELSVVAHLTGWAMPVPTDEVLQTLRTMVARQRDCALSHAVDAAVGVRVEATAGIRGLDDHIVDALRARLDGRRLCAAEEPDLVAVPYRWSLVSDALLDACRADPKAPRHSRTAEWERQHGAAIPGSTAAEQLACVQQWLDADQRDLRRLRRLAFGARTPATIETAVGCNASDDHWPTALPAALGAFIRCTWPHRYLTAPR